MNPIYQNKCNVTNDGVYLRGWPNGTISVYQDLVELHYKTLKMFFRSKIHDRVLPKDQITNIYIDNYNALFTQTSNGVSVKIQVEIWGGSSALKKLGEALKQAGFAVETP